MELDKGLDVFLFGLFGVLLFFESELGILGLFVGFLYFLGMIFCVCPECLCDELALMVVQFHFTLNLFYHFFIINWE